MPQTTSYLSDVTMLHGYKAGLDVIWQYRNPRMRMSGSDKLGSLQFCLTIHVPLVFQAGIIAQRSIGIFKEYMPCSQPFVFQV